LKLHVFWQRRPFTRLASLLTSFPFSQPAIGTILFSTVAGIVMSFGTEFLLSFVGDDDVRPLGPQQLAGTLMLIASVMLSIVAWQMQAFQDHLVTINKDKESPHEKRYQFRAWKGRRSVWLVAASAMVTMLSAMLVLACSLRCAAAATGE